MTAQPKITAPLLYRLLDQDPSQLREQVSAKTIDLNTLYEDIRLNLEHLLNSRSTHLSLPSQYAQLPQSLLNYGVPDFTHHYYGSRESQQQLCTQVTHIIKHFETRLTSVNVIPLESNIALERTLKIRIDAAIDIAPSPVNAVFESTLDIVNNHFTLE